MKKSSPKSRIQKRSLRRSVRRSARRRSRSMKRSMRRRSLRRSARRRSVSRSMRRSARRRSRSMKRSVRRMSARRRSVSRRLRRSIRRSVRRMSVRRRRSMSRRARRSVRRSVCKSGEIMKVGYTTKRGVKVSPTCIKDLGAKGKGPKVIPPLKQGSLMGYSTKLSETERRNILKQVMKRYDYATVIRRLNAIRTLLKRTSPMTSKLIKDDMMYIQMIAMKM